MTNFIPIFPLHIVVFPREELNLHIFEPRYKQLINECFQQKKPFGIPAVINNELKDYGSLLRVEEIAQTYANGEMDIKTKGGKVFRMLEVIKEVPEKLYSGAIVNYPHNVMNGDEQVMKILIGKMKDLHASLQVNKDFHKAESKLTSYDIAHHSGLTLEQEYEFLQLTQERQRQEYLKRHFEATLPALEEMKQLREKIQMNGHFKNLEGFDVK
ncbi:LON peptidase substrate-binding domain-containing protein [Niabella ginsengisoli]|uniref:LON peptidase substrate-binding domain-containing protein n=1 Tax=Niabella ginsengisoli TaxID=522298 RepID=A0ABS9SMX0_9BACT|nr:LON peptidase substrate-binding domain-containing protein [Niabella ginsengisoli]MCH5599697.1 LON peptidase substrate-binding domain-containing protein [Niabella ginsengisoli]